MSVVIVSVLLGIGVPSFVEIIRTNQTVTQTNKFTRDINYARSEAVRRGVSVAVCKSSSGAGCTGGSNWADGWIVFTDENDNNAVNGDDEILQIAEGLDANYTLSAGGNFANNISFDASGALNNSADAFTVCRPDGDETLSRRIGVSITGRVSITIPGAGACP